MEGPRVLRPMGYGEIFNEAFDVYKRHFILFAGIGAVVYIPWALMAVFTAEHTLLNQLISIGFYIPLVAAGGATVKAFADVYLGKEATIAGSWRHVLRRLAPFLLTSLLAWLMLVGGFLLFCIPGIIVAFWLFFLWSVMIVEDRFYLEAIRRCRELAAGQWGRVFILAVLAFLINMAGALLLIAIVAIPQGLLTAAASGVASLAAKLLQAVIFAGVQTVLTPFTSMLTVLLYFDVRVRKEGFDIELLAQEMGEFPAGGGPYAAPA